LACPRTKADWLPCFTHGVERPVIEDADGQVVMDDQEKVYGT
jgi:hypothetical protein